MEYQWNTTYHNIGLVWEPKIVRVKSNEDLMAFFLKGKRRNAKMLACFARAEYQRRYDLELHISERSLACEIYWHYYIWKKARDHERRHGKRRLSGWLLFHMDVIDCGERDVDNNRFLWDLLSILF